jgi:hypothetical protein
MLIVQVLVIGITMQQRPEKVTFTEKQGAKQNAKATTIIRMKEWVTKCEDPNKRFIMTYTVIWEGKIFRVKDVGVNAKATNLQLLSYHQYWCRANC